ncbi:MAG: hypothetical protein GF334_06370 [Candidatus Altiarchaeales archaeon]|nr:hypothetical protein [Candidatus Altiarchaeales archaeon]
MKPVVPKVRVGDILRGTKNLRNYLRLCSLAHYLRTVTEEGIPRRHREEASRELYSPRKDDEFLVVGNNFDRFCVWESRGEIMLLFQNGRPGGLSAKQLAAAGAAAAAAAPAGAENKEIAMSGSHFAKWFSRTGRMFPDLNQWDKKAFYMWGAIQMNASRNRTVALPVYLHDGVDAIGRIVSPLRLAKSIIDFDKATIRKAIKESLQTGRFRGHPVSFRRLGPSLEDIPKLEEEVAKLARNPRATQHLKFSDLK